MQWLASAMYVPLSSSFEHCHSRLTCGLCCLSIFAHVDIALPIETKGPAVAHMVAAASPRLSSRLCNNTKDRIVAVAGLARWISYQMHISPLRVASAEEADIIFVPMRFWEQVTIYSLQPGLVRQSHGMAKPAACIVCALHNTKFERAVADNARQQYCMLCKVSVALDHCRIAAWS